MDSRVRTFALRARSLGMRLTRQQHLSYARLAYSQEGEDLVLNRLFEGDARPDHPGFYVDVGAHHPHRFSNTYYFYQRGWRGLNLDAMPGSMVAFQRARPRDRNVEAAVSDVEQTLMFHIFNEPALNSFSAAQASEYERNPAYHIVERRAVQTRTLASLLHEHLTSAQTIDFMSVDVEGLDLPVLRSNDWERFRPRYVLAEDHAAFALGGADVNPLRGYLAEVGYELCARTVLTSFFRDRR